MSLEFLPNQPIIFEKPIGDFPCLNNDLKTYGQLMQDGDELCIQWKLSACNEPMCEPNMEGTPGPDELGAWSCSGGWTSTGSDNLSFDGTTNGGLLAGQNITSVIGCIYRITFNVTNYAGIATYQVRAGNGLSQIYTFDSVGSYTFYLIADENPFTITIATTDTTTAADQLDIADIEVVQWTACWQDTLNPDRPTWSYTFDGLNGKFCSTDPTGGDLINTNAISAPGTYHGIKLTISDCTQGGVIVTLGGTTIGSQTSGNGDFTFYGIPYFGVDLVISKADNFDGCISQVKVYDYGDIASYEIHFEDLTGALVSNDEAPTVFEDRIIWCGVLEDLTWTRNGNPAGRIQCETLKTFIYDPCEAVMHESVNVINYKNTGWECTKVVESWNDGFAFGLYFGDIAAPDFKLRQRLRFLAFNPVYRNTGEEYLYSSGNTGRSFAQSQKARTAWFDYMDEYAHDCTRVQLLSQKLFVDNYAFYYPTEDYEPEWNERGAYNLAQSRVTLLHEEAIFGSTCGTLANAVCPPQVVNVPIELSQVIVNINSVNVAFNLTDMYVTYGTYDSSGILISTNTSTNYDLTNGIDRVAFATYIANQINTAFGTITSTVSCTISGSDLTLNVVCNGNISNPMEGLGLFISDAFISSGLIPLPLPITFA